MPVCLHCMLVYMFGSPCSHAACDISVTTIIHTYYAVFCASNSSCEREWVRHARHVGTRVWRFGQVIHVCNPCTCQVPCLHVRQWANACRRGNISNSVCVCVCVTQMFAEVLLQGAPRQIMLENDWVQRGAYVAGQPATHTGTCPPPPHTHTHTQSAKPLPPTQTRRTHMRTRMRVYVCVCLCVCHRQDTVPRV